MSYRGFYEKRVDSTNVLRRENMNFSCNKKWKEKKTCQRVKIDVYYIEKRMIPEKMYRSTDAVCDMRTHYKIMTIYIYIYT